jgi:hypothetical protein
LRSRGPQAALWSRLPRLLAQAAAGEELDEPEPDEPDEPDELDESDDFDELDDFDESDEELSDLVEEPPSELPLDDGPVELDELPRLSVR